MKEELLPCPFCGRKAQYFELRGGHFIQCKIGIGNGNKHNIHSQSKEEAFQQWNTRVEKGIKNENK